MSPVLPSEVKALVIDDTDDLCAAIKKLIKSFILAARYVSYKYASSGAISDAYCSEIVECSANSTTSG